MFPAAAFVRNGSAAICATAIGDAPRCSSNRRRMWRGRDGRDVQRGASTSPRSSAPSPDQAQRTRDRRRCPVPRRRPRARPPGGIADKDEIPRRLGRRRGCVDADVLLQRTLRRTDRPAVDARRCDRNEQPSVEARIVASQRVIPASVIELHGHSIAELCLGELAVFRTWNEIARS